MSLLNAFSREQTTPPSTHRALCTQPVTSRLFYVDILERHPFTTQTFVPLWASPNAQYIVVVAPACPTDDRCGPPQIEGLRAFFVTQSQGVTYAPGTWHAPMIVTPSSGDSAESARIDFVVTQFMDGTERDCEEVFVRECDPRGVLITVPWKAKASVACDEGLCHDQNL